MTPGTSQAGRRILLNRLYAEYEADKRFERLRKEAGEVIVPGDGPMDPRLMFIGEAPGATEAKQRRPFVGASGHMLNKLLASVGLDRADVFVTNVVKYRPVTETGHNRTPADNEVRNGYGYIRREHRLLGKPPMVMLGKHSRRAVEHGYKLRGGLGMVIGQWFWMGADGGFPVLPLYHPAYALYQASNQPLLFEQFQAVLRPPASKEECDAAQ